MIRDAWFIFLNEARIARTDPTLFAILFAMPFVVLYLTAPAVRPALILAGYEDASGAELAMPGMAILFGNFGMAFLAFAVFREHTWNTWDRLMHAPVSMAAVFTGKALLPFFLVLLQQFVMLAAAAWIFDVRLSGELAAYALTSVCFAFFVVCAGFWITAVCATMQQVNAIINIGSLILAGLGGAFAPVEQLPAWMQSAAIFSPNYWAIQALRSTILDGAGLIDVLPSALVLCGTGLALLLFALLRFSGDHRKMSWA